MSCTLPAADFARLSHVTARRVDDVDARLAARLAEVRGEHRGVAQQIGRAGLVALERNHHVRSGLVARVQPAGRAAGHDRA